MSEQTEEVIINNVRHRRGKHGLFAEFYDELRKQWKTSRFLNVELDFKVLESKDE